MQHNNVELVYSTNTFWCFHLCYVCVCVLFNICNRWAISTFCLVIYAFAVQDVVRLLIICQKLFFFAFGHLCTESNRDCRCIAVVTIWWFVVYFQYENDLEYHACWVCVCVCLYESVCVAQRCFSAINVMLMVNGLMKPHNECCPLHALTITSENGHINEICDLLISYLSTA